MTFTFLVIIASLASLQNLADPEVHVIPMRYAGEVTIVFRAANGEPALSENGARLYRIPQNGILLTQAEPNAGTPSEWRFFQVTAEGERFEIKHVWPGLVQDTPENRSNPDVEVFAFSGGRLELDPIPCAIEVEQYFVGTRLQLLTRDDRAERRRLTDLLTQTFACKKRPSNTRLHPAAAVRDRAGLNHSSARRG